MSSLPPRVPQIDPHKLTAAQNVQQATRNVNRFAKRDPALYPLSFILVGALGVAGYFLTSKAAEPEPHRRLMQHGVINPWDDASKHDVHPSAAAAFKYRHKTRDGHWEDSLPTLSDEEIHTLKSSKRI